MSIARANRRFKFHKRGQYFIRVHNERFPSPRCASATKIEADSVIETHEHKGEFNEP